MIAEKLASKMCTWIGKNVCFSMNLKENIKERCVSFWTVPNAVMYSQVCLTWVQAHILTGAILISRIAIWAMEIAGVGQGRCRIRNWDWHSLVLWWFLCLPLWWGGWKGEGRARPCSPGPLRNPGGIYRFATVSSGQFFTVLYPGVILKIFRPNLPAWWEN